MGDDNTSVVNGAEKQQENNKLTGFQLHPENINVKGRPPKGHSITETIRAMMDEKPEIKKALGAKILQMAVEGDITAIKTIWNYIDGMPLQKSELTGADGMPLNIEVVAYGHNNTQRLPTDEVHGTSVSGPTQVSSAQLASEGSKDDVSSQ